jgi:hypothetical protein
MNDIFELNSDEEKLIELKEQLFKTQMKIWYLESKLETQKKLDFLKTNKLKPNSTLNLN